MLAKYTKIYNHTTEVCSSSSSSSSSSRLGRSPKSSLPRDRIPDRKTDSPSGAGAGVASFADASNFAGMTTGDNSAVGASEVVVVVVVVVMLVTIGFQTMGIGTSAFLPAETFNFFSLRSVDFVDPPDIVEIRFLFFVDPSGRPLPLGAGYELSG
jgi:hypothetical protein